MLTPMARRISMLLLAAMLTAALPAAGQELAPGGTFTDDNASVHEADIEGLVAAGITTGCADARYCPDDAVTRGQMAAFLRRGLAETLIPDAAVVFTDDDDSVFEADIEWLAGVGVTTGCGPGLYCPDEPVTRGQMAAFLVRALGLPSAGPSPFTDSDGVFEDDIARLAAEGITTGCSSDRFCPDDVVTRAQMASFLVRALGLDPIVPPPIPGSEGCGLTPLSSGRYTVTLDGDSRTYLLDIPDGYRSTVRYPLVYGFHGAGGTPEDFRVYSRLLSAAGEAILVFPAAGPTDRWLAADDLAFFDEIHRLVGNSTCVDIGRVFATGHSSGGFMANALGCQRGDVIRGVGSVAGGGPFTSTCDGPTAAWITHGTNDPIVPFVSGTSSRDRWLDVNGCDPGSTEDRDRGVTYVDCTSDVPVVWVEQSLFHLWPSWAASEMWEFFQSLP
jgi:polyhydroxybutyrate depolymerase